MINKKEMEWIKLMTEYKYQIYNETDGGDGGRCDPPVRRAA